MRRGRSAESLFSTLPAGWRTRVSLDVPRLVRAVAAARAAAVSTLQVIGRREHDQAIGKIVVRIFGNRRGRGGAGHGRSGLWGTPETTATGRPVSTSLASPVINAARSPYVAACVLAASAAGCNSVGIENVRQQFRQAVQEMRDDASILDSDGDGLDAFGATAAKHLLDRRAGMERRHAEGGRSGTGGERSVSRVEAVPTLPARSRERAPFRHAREPSR